MRDPAGIVFRGPQVPCGSFVRDRSSGRLDVDPGSERRSDPSPYALRHIHQGGLRSYGGEDIELQKVVGGGPLAIPKAENCSMLSDRNILEMG